MGVGSSAVAAAAVVAVVGGVLLLSPATTRPSDAPPTARWTTLSAQVEYAWPSGEPVDVARPFTAPDERWSAGHRGVDLLLPVGHDVRAAADGVVAFAGSVAGRGVVSIDHADGVRTTYEPLAAVVGRGQPVSGGQVIGQLEGEGHCAPATCLHWGARRGSDDYLDPLGLVTEEVIIRLLPHHRP